MSYATVPDLDWDIEFFQYVDDWEENYADRTYPTPSENYENTNQASLARLESVWDFDFSPVARPDLESWWYYLDGSLSGVDYRNYYVQARFPDTMTYVARSKHAIKYPFVIEGKTSGLTLKVIEPITGAWISFEKITYEHWDGQSYWYTHGCKMLSSDPAYEQELGSNSYSWDSFFLMIDETGLIRIEWHTISDLPIGLFTEGNELSIELAYTNSFIDLTYTSLRAMLFDPNDSYNDLWSQRDGFYASTGMQQFQMSGEIIGPCIGEPQGPVLDTAEVTWCGNANSDIGSMRNSIEAEAGRIGFLIDASLENSYHVVGIDLETSPYPTCDPDNDGFIQSVNAENPSGLYSLYALKPVNESVLGTGEFEGRDLEFTYNTDRTEFDIAAADWYFVFIGPKNVINYGLQGTVPYTWSFNSTTAASWSAEEPAKMEALETKIQIATGEALLFDFTVPPDRNSPLVLNTLTTVDDMAALSGMAEIDREHIAYLLLEENGTSYIVSIVLYKFNFVTEALDLVATYPMWTDEPRPLEYTAANNRLVFIPTHGTNGRLYVGQPGYTGSKAGEGKIHALEWTGSAFTVGTPIIKGIRNGAIGSCIGWDDKWDYLMFGVAVVDIQTVDGSGVDGPSFSISKSFIANTFGVGDGKVILWDASVPTSKVYYSSNGSGYVSSNALGTYSYDCEIMEQTCITYPNGRANPRRSRLSTKDATSTYRFTGYATETGIGYSSSYPYNYAWSYKDPLRLLHWYSHWLYTKVLADNYVPTTSSFKADALPTTPYLQCANNAVFWDGAEQESLCFIVTSADKLRHEAHIAKVEPSLQPHIWVGDFYIRYDFNLSGGIEILTASCIYTWSSVALTNVRFFFKTDQSPNYMVALGGGIFTSYSTLEEAKANANPISLLATEMPYIDILDVDLLEMYVVLDKELITAVSSNRTYSASITSITFEVTDPGLSEPIICTHFSESEMVKEVYKTTADVMTIKTPAQSQAAGTGMNVSGSFTRPSYS